MKSYGKLNWAISAGRIPFLTNGDEPEFTSHDKIAVLNTSGEKAYLELSIFYEDAEPVGLYKFEVAPHRLRKVRFNDLIDPTAMQLQRNYGCLIKSNTPVVVQFSRMDTGAKANAQINTLAYPAENHTQ